MLVIRKSQMHILANAGLHEAIARHICLRFPELVADSSHKAVLKFVQTAIDRAKFYGVSSARQICKFVDVAVVLGLNFDDDPSFPWAAAVLSNCAAPPDCRVDTIVAAVTSYLGDA